MIEIFIKASSGRWLKASLLNVKRKAINTPCNTIRIQMFTVCTIPPPAKKLGVVQRLKPAKSNIYARPRAGFFFCLASAEDAGLLFCLAAILANTSVYSGFYTIHASYTDHAATHRMGLCSGFSCDYAHSTAANTRPIQADINNTTCATLERITTPGRPQPIPDTTATPAHCTAQHSRLL